MSAVTVTKCCVRCKVDKPLSEFYMRSGRSDADDPTHYLSECKCCLKDRSRKQPRHSRNVPLVKGERLAITRMSREGIHAAPGKALSYADVDVVAWGCVKIEVKYAKLGYRHRLDPVFMFATTPRQQQRGLLADVILLICEWKPKLLSYHVFDAAHPVFFKDGRLKTGVEFCPGNEGLKHSQNRVILTQSLMDAHRDAWHLIETKRLEYSQKIWERG